MYISSAMTVQTLRNDLDPTQLVSAVHVRPEVLEIVSGEFRSLLADYLLLKASIYLGGRWSTPEVNKKTVSTLFRQSAELDPYFFQTCYYIQGYLPWWRKDYVHEGIEALEIFRNHREWDWQPGFYIGFNYFYFLEDNQTAARYLMETAKRHPNQADSLGFLGARLSQKGGQTKASIAFLKTMIPRTENEWARKELQKRLTALEGVRILEKAIKNFRAMFFDHPPDTLDRLVEVGILKALPENPARKDGLYLYKNGQIDF